MPQDQVKKEEYLFIVPIPSLVAVLLNKERAKGSTLTEEEVLSIRDNCRSVALPASAKLAVEERRGYDDLDPENVWEEWQEARKQLAAE